MPSFKSRSTEMTLLEDQLKKEGPQLFVLQGMRRVGKTELLKKFSSRKSFFYFCAASGTEQDQLQRFKQAIERMYRTPLSRRLAAISWETLFTFMIDNISRRASLLILDEYQILEAANRGIAHILSRIWMERARNKNLVLILAGSDAAVMEDDILSGDSPLHRHVTGALRLEPLLFSESRVFFPHYSGPERVLCFAALGGMPAYMTRFDPRKPLEQNIKNEILDKDCYLFREPLLHLWEEMREPSHYFSLLHAVARGFTRLPDIARESGMRDIYAANKYLFSLRERRILRRVLPFSEKDPQKSRKGRYDFNNPFFRFWFRYVYPFKSDLELGEVDSVWKERIKPDLNSFCRFPFVDICRQRLERLKRYSKLPFEADKIGFWWNRTDSIDLVAEGLNGEVLLCHCDWADVRLGSGCLKSLARKARWFPDASRVYYGFFSGEGFSNELKMKAAESSDILLLDYY